MTNSSGRLSSTMMATIAVSVAVATIGTADAAEECLTTPKTGTPTGQHWFYRIESGTKRHCWYLGDQGKTSSRVSTVASPRRAAPDPSRTNDNALARSTADARAEWQIPQALTENDKDLAFPPEGLRPPVAPESPAQGAPVNPSTANPDRSSEVTGLPQPNGVAPSAGTPPTPLSMQETNAIGANTAGTNTAETNTGATTETTVASTAITPTESEDSVIGTIPFLIGLTLIILGALILLGIFGSAIYRRVKARAERRSYNRFGYEPTDGAQQATQSQLEVDDNLYRMREMLARLKHEAQPQSEEVGVRLYSGQL
jgi:hypothetical protein